MSIPLSAATHIASRVDCLGNLIHAMAQQVLSGLMVKLTAQALQMHWIDWLANYQPLGELISSDELPLRTGHRYSP